MLELILFDMLSGTKSSPTIVLLKVKLPLNSIKFRPVGEEMQLFLHITRFCVLYQTLYRCLIVVKYSHSLKHGTEMIGKDMALFFVPLILDGTLTRNHLLPLRE